MPTEIDYSEKSLPFQPVRERDFDSKSPGLSGVSPTYQSSAISPMIQGNPGSHRVVKVDDAQSNEKRHYQVSPTFAVSRGNAAVLSAKSNTMIDWTRRSRDH
jgi:hypothetical protein